MIDRIIQEKAMRINRICNNGVSLVAESGTECSRGWLRVFKNRKAFRRYKLHCEIGDADHEAAEAARPLFEP